ncbi:MAG: phosphotransferase family protein [Micropruina sp.]|uniref:phosphotransferase family protein n=1 Tax=Micropruina sp. TaxID=2737536 RepID=UPI0039E2305C
MTESSTTVNDSARAGGEQVGKLVSMSASELRDRLETLFAEARPGRSSFSIGPLKELSGGWANSLYGFTLRPAPPADWLAQDLVLKMYAPDARGLDHAERELRALSELGAIGYPVPGVERFELDGRSFGRPFIMMESIEGGSFWDAFEAADAPGRALLVEEFVKQLIALHACDPRLLDPDAELAHPYGYIEQELGRLRADSDQQAVLGEIVDWLEMHKGSVPCERLSVLHRDYHPWNVLVTAERRLVVIDWDWQIGDARFDLAWACMLIYRSGAPELRISVRKEYEHQLGFTPEGLDYFEVLTTARWLLNVLPAAAIWEDFRTFLIDPIRRAETILKEHTDIEVVLQTRDC